MCIQYPVHLLVDLTFACPEQAIESSAQSDHLLLTQVTETEAFKLLIRIPLSSLSHNVALPYHPTPTKKKQGRARAQFLRRTGEALMHTILNYPHMFAF